VILGPSGSTGFGLELDSNLVARVVLQGASTLSQELEGQLIRQRLLGISDSSVLFTPEGVLGATQFLAGDSTSFLESTGSLSLNRRNYMDSSHLTMGFDPVGTIRQAGGGLVGNTTKLLTGSGSITRGMRIAIGGVGITDLGYYQHNVVIPYGKVQQDTDDAVFGTAAMRISSGGYLQPVARTVAFLGEYKTFVEGSPYTDRFTIEFWLKTTQNEPAMVLKMNSFNPSYCYCFIENGKAVLFLKNYGVGEAYVDTISQVNDGNWHHIAFVRNDEWLLAFKDGFLETSVYIGPASYYYNGQLYVGYGDYLQRAGYPSYFIDWFDGSLDDLRITRNISRYTASFTPPTEALPGVTDYGDIKYDNVALLLLGNGEQSSTTIVDSSKYQRTPVSNGIATISNYAVPGDVFTGQQLYFDNRTNATGLIYNLPVSHLMPGTGCFEFSFTSTYRFPGGGSLLLAQIAIPNYQVNPYGAFLLNIYITFPASGPGILACSLKKPYSNTVDVYYLATNITEGASQHLALEFISGNTIGAYYNGVLVLTINPGFSLYYSSGNGTLVFGRPGNMPTDGINKGFCGYMEQVRITAGVPRYSNNGFTASPLTAYTKEFKSTGPISEDPHIKDVTLLLSGGETVTEMLSGMFPTGNLQGTLMLAGDTTFDVENEGNMLITKVMSGDILVDMTNTGSLGNNTEAADLPSATMIRRGTNREMVR
jgi:hypothetical protein